MTIRQTVLPCLAAALSAGILRGGAVVVTSGMSFVGGVQIDTNGQIHVARTSSELVLPLSQVVWHTTSSEITTKLEAAKEAIRTGAPKGVARRLLQASMSEEPDTRAEAMKLHSEVVAAEQAAQQEAANSAGDAAPEPRAHHDVGVTLSIQKTDIQGWKSWGPSGSPYSSMQTPVFSNSRINTSGILRAD